MKYLYLIALVVMTLFSTINSVAQPTLNTPTNGSTVSTSFTIGISSYPGATNYDIELSKDGTFTGTYPNYQGSIAGGRSLSISGLSYGQTYNIRWRANNSAYGTATVTTSNLNTPILASPSSGATNLAISFSISISSVTGATSYDIELSKDGFFSGSSPNYQALINSTNRVLSVSGLSYGQSYYIRWRARNSTNNSSYGTTTVTTANLATPTLSTPSTGSTNLPLSFNIGINSVTGATSYDIELSSDGTYSGSSPNYQTSINSPSRTLAITGLSYNHTYYIRWRARNSTNNSSYGTTTLSTKSLDEITVSNIVNGTYYNSSSVTFTLSSNGVTASSWDWQFDTTNVFSSSALTTVNTTSGSYVFNRDNFISGAHYYVRVRMNTSAGSSPYSSSSNIKDFYNALHLATITGPGEGLVLNRLGTKLSTIIITNATTHLIQLSKTSDFSQATTYTLSPLYNSQNVLEMGYNVTDLDPYTQYYVRGIAYNEHQASTYSPTISFNTGGVYLVLSKPLDGATNISTNTQFAITYYNATFEEYAIVYSTSADFQNADTVTSTSRSFNANTTPNSTIYAMLRFKKNGTWYNSLESSISFTTQIDDARVASLRFSNPTNGAANVSTSFNATVATFTAQAYQMEYSLSADFSNSTTIQSSSRIIPVTGLTNGTTYYARLKAEINGIWYTATLSTISFTTKSSSSKLSATYPINSEEMIIEPNPYNNSFSINLMDQEGFLTIYNMQGELVESYRGEFNKNFGSNLNNGIYILRVETQSGKVYKKKIIKN